MAVTKTILKKSKCRRSKWLSEYNLKISEKKEKLKQGRKGKIYPVNTVFQRIGRRAKKVYLSEQCKEIEENNAMKRQDIFKKIRVTKGTFHAKMVKIKNRNCTDLTEAVGINKQCQEYTEELCKKDLQYTDNYNGVITHLEPDILEFEVKASLGSITMEKTSGADGMSIKPFRRLKDDSRKVLHSICQQMWKTQQLPQDWESLIFSPILKKGITKECSHYHTVAPMSNGRNIMLKILQSRLQQFMNNELPHVQAGFRKGWGMKDQINNIHEIIKKARDLKKKKSTSASFFRPKPLSVGITTNCSKNLKWWENQTTWPNSWEICIQVKNQQAMWQQAPSKSGKDYAKTVYCHSLYLISMQCAACEMPGWMKHKLELILLGEISINSENSMTSLLWQ